MTGARARAWARVASLALALAPALVAAYPNHAYPCDVPDATGVCVGEYDGGDCEAGASRDHATGVAARAFGPYVLDAGGASYCDSYEGGEHRVNVIYVETGVVTFAWAEETCTGAVEYCEAPGCSVWVWPAVPVYGHRVPCDTPPPDPGWGHLLP